MKNELGLFERKGDILVSSRIIAEKFEKPHKEIIYILEGRTSETSDGEIKINNNSLINDLRQGGISHLEQYFIKSTYKGDNHKEYTEYLCSRDGFTLLTMGLIGQKALKFKLAYINAFNAMESVLRERQSTEWLQTREKGKIVRREETDAIQLLIPYAEKQGSKNMAKKAYVTYSKMVNKSVGLESGQRDTASYKTLMLITLMEDIISNTIIEEIEKGTYYKNIYKICKAKIHNFVNLTYLQVS